MNLGKLVRISMIYCSSGFSKSCHRLNLSPLYLGDQFLLLINPPALPLYLSLVAHIISGTRLVTALSPLLQTYHFTLVTVFTASASIARGERVKHWDNAQALQK